MEHESITRLREIAATPRNSRNMNEWPMPVKPSDLLILFEHYDELILKNSKAINPSESKVDETPLSFMRVKLWG
jgi:hypothetical protein